MNEQINVLLIEDNPGDIRLVQEMLRESSDFNINLMVAENLDKGLKLIASEYIQVILLDLNFPESHGINTFRHVKKFALTVPIIILSILSDNEIIYQAMKEGAQDYLIKGSIKNEALIRSINYAVWCAHHV